MVVEQQQAKRQTVGARVLVASEDALLRHQLAADLIEFGLWLTAASSERAVLDEISARAVDLLVIDARQGGAGIVEALRKQSQAPVIALVREGDSDAALAAFDAGADDAVNWPWDPRDLGRRIDAMLRRYRPAQQAEDIIEGPQQVRLRPRAHEVSVAETPVDLTPKEFVLLQLLLEHRGDVLTADQLSATLWGHQTFGARNFVEAHVSRLRAKLRTAGAPEVISTIRGVGYKVR